MRLPISARSGRADANSFHVTVYSPPWLGRLAVRGVVGVRVFAARACSVYSATEKPSADDKDSSARAVSDGVPRIEHGALSTHKTQG